MALTVLRKTEIKQYKLQRIDPVAEVAKAKPGTLKFAGIETQWRIQEFLRRADLDRRHKRERREQFAKMNAELARLEAENPPVCMCGDGNAFSRFVCAIHGGRDLTPEAAWAWWMDWRREDSALRRRNT